MLPLGSSVNLQPSVVETTPNLTAISDGFIVAFIVCGGIRLCVSDCHQRSPPNRGKATATNAVDSGAPQRFYILQLQ